ncbi:type II toxin-antitoxin system PemK/MazF family toxin [Herbiconiux daphne]|uniref:Type II toxin-antitoxin system PemK/MazF family toxin n=1 Tax=Herbiconiux daphne TaxID=2970914 RepID=A0ABT2H849_9MICO|nr:type II toxin-antitoxin system PemK/MazF family toxin [Herbiconiux daphne]MCS5736135.1 type II toxin-antitoxin system PemK/MazF family toxin [Herbiconiux daphne]
MSDRSSAVRAGGDRGDSPGRFGASATVEVDPATVGAVDISYNPSTDGDADPGEIVWTWVPYQENDGRGKDRPVLVVAREGGGTVLAMQLTSKPHDDVYDVAIGSGAWDSAGRPSWVRLERVFRLHQAGMRREAFALDAARFALVAAALSRRFGWRAAGAGAAPRAGAGAASRTGAAPRAGAASPAGAPARSGNPLVRAIRLLMPPYGARKSSR